MRRRWFQIHLSTAVVLMVCAGGLLWLNFRALPTNDPAFKEMFFELEGSPWFMRGWPWVWEDWSFPIFGAGPRYYWGHLVLDVGVAFLILTSVAAFMEFLIRRREARAPVGQ